MNGTALTYDANGNMLQGYDGKVMTYDAENRPLTVQKSGVLTEYVYGADGSRLKLITGGQTTVTFAEVEVRNFLSGSESIFTQPHPLVRLENGLVPSYMHRDHLNSVHLVMSDVGTVEDRRTYKPFGEMRSWTDPAAIPDAKGWIGERYDVGAGLQYLNARYYDPKLGIFLQPDWWEVTEPGVGTNRYAYSANDPINAKDPSGNIWEDVVSFFDRAFSALTGDSGAKDRQNQRYAEGLGRSQIELNRFEEAVNAGDYDHISNEEISRQFDFRKDQVDKYARRLKRGLGSAAVDSVLMGAYFAGLKGGVAARSIGASSGTTDDISRVASNSRNGHIAEGLVDILGGIGPKKPIVVGGRTRIPDGLTTKTLSEIKNLKHLSATSQIRDFVRYAQKETLTMDLYVRRSTTFSGPMEKLISSGLVNLKFLP